VKRVLLVIFATAAVPCAARAQDSAQATAAARALFQQGVECADHEEWACAVERFEQAYRLRSSPVIGSNLGIALIHVDRLVEASERFQAVMRDPATTAAMREEVSGRIAEIGAHIGHLTIRLTGSPEGATLTLDGHDVPISMAGVAAPCDPGDHTIEVHRGDAIVASASTHLEVAGSAEVSLDVPAPPREAISIAPDRATQVLVIAAPPPPSHPPQFYEEWWFWTIIGVVVVGAGVGIGIGIATSGSSAPPSGSLGIIDGRM